MPYFYRSTKSWIAGIRKANVLPVPVLAWPTTSWPSRITGRVCYWTAVKFSYLNTWEIAFLVFTSMSRSSNLISVMKSFFYSSYASSSSSTALTGSLRIVFASLLTVCYSSSLTSESSTFLSFLFFFDFLSFFSFLSFLSFLFFFSFFFGDNSD